MPGEGERQESKCPGPKHGSFPFRLCSLLDVPAMRSHPLLLQLNNGCRSGGYHDRELDPNREGDEVSAMLRPLGSKYCLPGSTLLWSS